MNLIIQNQTAIALSYQSGAVSVPASGSLTVTDDTTQANLTTDTGLMSDIQAGNVLLSDGFNEYAGISAAAFLSGFIRRPTQVSAYSSSVVLPQQQPFASPMYRTKISGISSPFSCPPNASTVIDFIVTNSSMFATGGEILVQNAQFGDYIMAQIYDVNSVIPVADQSACESWPNVAMYVVKGFLQVDSSSNGYFILDTRPLAAEIPQGTSMRITYTATATGVARNCVANYFLNAQLPASSVV